MLSVGFYYIETLLSKEDRSLIGIDPRDTKEQKKAAAVKFADAVAHGVQHSKETYENFNQLFSWLLERP